MLLSSTTTTRTTTSRWSTIVKTERDWNKNEIIEFRRVILFVISEPAGYDCYFLIDVTILSTYQYELTTRTSMTSSLNKIDRCDSNLWSWSLLLGNLSVRLVAASDLLATPFWSRGLLFGAAG
jgi:hypothetical protein